MTDNPLRRTVKWCIRKLTPAPRIDEHTPDAELISIGSRDAWDVLFKRYKGLIRSIARRYTSNPSDIDDVVQEVDYRIYRGIAWYRDQLAFGAWVRAITRNYCHDRFIRPLKVAHESIDYLDLAAHAGFGADPAKELEKAELYEIVRKAIADLGEMYRVPYVLYEIEGLPYQEIERKLDIPHTTLTNRLRVARVRIREQVAIYLDRRAVVKAPCAPETRGRKKNQTVNTEATEND
ncbi:MAG TPA: sigma-70 family RNA polymerase sigma factor [Chthonomonadaceae bacterium]|nr:sigma-70 family RNA polymerase sigma factor [Chthonomonadaceae bacterium]